MENKEKTIGLYIRVSTRNKEQIGLEMQRKECTRVSSQLFGQEIDLKCYTDIGFGTKCNTKLNRMLEDAKQGKLNAIITYEVHRISHTLSHALNVVKEIHNANVRFVSIIEGEYNPPHTSLAFNILETVAQYERENHAERIRQGIAFKKQPGKDGVYNGK
jgi:DNA invertase Pin-like site-specific DNA recombinase